ncbi:cAMP-regulated phosphoprotein 19 [Galemys pyrenaicus]|uniref:cAMP-regulated phosphoprotein 19 n=2 Tax=Talpidae TaxID=9373 RepID=A0A8J5ZQT8_GALPY|nr:cAMP-regulated phosphoprotein 19 [Galemys pyrenaicus]
MRGGLLYRVRRGAPALPGERRYRARAVPIRFVSEGEETLGSVARSVTSANVSDATSFGIRRLKSEYREVIYLRLFQEMEDKVTSPEKAEEAKLKARYPHLGQKPGGSDFLRKRLQKGQKYFDSGDYNMAKAKMKNKQLPAAAPDKTEVTGDHIPTPQDLPQRKPSLVTSKLAG